MKPSRSAVKLHFSDFWRGLTTPAPAVLRMACVMLLGIVAVCSILAWRLRVREEAGGVRWQDQASNYCRASVMAMRGASRETDSRSKTLVFVGPSAMRCWLPHPDDATGVASAATGSPVKVLSMCGDKQGYAVSSALIDRFGADFDGWFVVGVGRQTTARENYQPDKDFRRQESQLLGFESEVFRRDAAHLGFPAEQATGWELWDRRAFYFQCSLGFHLPFFGNERYNPYPPPRSIPSDQTGVGISRFNEKALDRHLWLFEQVAGRVKAGGRARLALVETPWVDDFVPGMQTADWLKDQADYHQAMEAWSRRTGVPWITAAERLGASVTDYSDSRHLGAPDLRRRFLEAVTRELMLR